MEEDKKKKRSTFREEIPNMILLICLYVIQGIPMGLIGSAIPLVLKQKYSYTQIGYIALALYPFSFKVLWSPLVDSYYIPSCGRRRSWIIPSQFLAGLLCLYMSYTIDSLTSDSSNALYLAALLTLVVFLFATQDIAVDSWGLTLLRAELQSFSAACQSIGLGLGHFISTTIFLVLNDPQFCNAYLNSAPSSEPILTLPTYFFILASVILASTFYLLLFKSEAPSQLDKNPGEHPQSLKQVMRLAFRLKDHKHVKTYMTILLFIKLGSSFLNSIGPLYLLELGYTQSTFAAMEVIHLPLQLYFGYLSGVVGATQQMTKYSKVIALQLIADIIFIIFASFGGESGWAISALIIVIITLSHMSHQLEFGIRSAFHRKIADQRIGGTYLTLINCMANMGNAWPKLFVFAMMDSFGFFVSAIAMNLVGWLVLLLARSHMKQLDIVKQQEWKLD